jgi:ribosome maturation factor RimP
MAMSVETLCTGVAPLLESLGLDLYDAELSRGTVRITLTKAGGVGLDELAAANSAVSAWLDEHEPFESRYTLEVSSPGVERPLRTPAHFISAIGEMAKLKVDEAVDPSRRVEGAIAAADSDGVTLTTSTGEVRVAYDQIERAKTTFAWGPTKKPSPSRAGSPKGPKRTRTITTQERITIR